MEEKRRVEQSRVVAFLVSNTKLDFPEIYSIMSEEDR